jgi:hypothetical protein
VVGGRAENCVTNGIWLFEKSFGSDFLNYLFYIVALDLLISSQKCSQPIKKVQPTEANRCLTAQHDPENVYEMRDEDERNVNFNYNNKFEKCISNHSIGKS